jgi:hypothetical protein
MFAVVEFSQLRPMLTPMQGLYRDRDRSRDRNGCAFRAPAASDYDHDYDYDNVPGPSLFFPAFLYPTLTPKNPSLTCRALSQPRCAPPSH